jgi:hypothetical protein
MVPATFFIDGFVQGTWKSERTRGKAMLQIEPFKALAREDRRVLAEEGEWLIRFIGHDSETFEVNIAERAYGESLRLK